MYVIGVAWAAAGNSEFHNSCPLSDAKACKCGSIVADVKINPPAVAIGPPKLMEPVFFPGIIVPSGAFHTVLPVNTSTASVVPHGRALHGAPLGENMNVRYLPYPEGSWSPDSPEIRWSWSFFTSLPDSDRGINFIHATKRLVFTIMRCRFESYAALPQFTPPTFPGAWMVPCKLGGVKIPSFREAAIFSWHHFASSAFRPQVSAASNFSGTSEIEENG